MAPAPGTNDAPGLQNADLAAEMRAYNATLTKAGEKSRPGRGGRGGGGGRGLTRGATIAAHSPGRMATVPNDGRVVGRLGNHTVSRESGPLRSSPLTTRLHSHASSAFGDNPWAGAQLTSNPLPRSTGGFASPGSIWASGAAQRPANGLPNAAVGVTGTSNVAASATPSGAMAPPPPPPVSTPAATISNGFQQVTTHPTPSGPEIVTNWSNDPDPKLPGHLSQPSAQAAIREIAELTGMDYNWLTSDGCTIPAPGPPLAATQRPRSVSTAVQSVPHVQQNVYSDPWMAPANDGHTKTEDGMDVDMGEAVATPSVEPTRFSNLQDSVWASERKPSGTLTATTPAFEPVASTNGYIPSRLRGTQGLTITAPATTVATAASLLSAFWDSTPAAVHNENARPTGTLQDSMWATPSTRSTPQKASNSLSFNGAGQSSTASSVPALSLSLSQGFNGASANGFGQISAQVPAQSPSGLDLTTLGPLSQISNVYNMQHPALVSTSWTFGQPNNPFGLAFTSVPPHNSFAPVPATASTPVAAAANPAPQVENPAEYLKDSMWAR